MKTQNKAIFAALSIMAISFVGCNKQEGDNLTSNEPVNFKTFVGKPIRGLPINKLDSINFGLFAYRGVEGLANGSSNYAIAANAQILNGGKAYADPNNTIYWPEGNDKLGFYAYAPYSNGLTVELSNFQPTTTGLDVFLAPSFGFRVNDEVSEQVDVLVAKTEAVSPMPSVALTFQHALSKIVLQAKTSAPNWRVAITDVQLRNIYNKGRYTFSVGGIELNSGWSVDKSAIDNYAVPLNLNGNTDPTQIGANAVVINTDVYINVSSVQEDGFLFLLPQKLNVDAALDITYRITNNSNNSLIVDTKTFTMKIGDIASLPSGFSTDWVAGNIVNYQVNFQPKPAGEPGSIITFDVSVDGWDTQDNPI